MKIYVKRKHIRDGQRDNVVSCPIALVLTEQLGVGDLKVADYEIVLGKTKFTCPTRAARFISKFDAGKPVKPFAFFLR